jgi:hypothetical protein
MSPKKSGTCTEGTCPRKGPRDKQGHVPKVRVPKKPKRNHRVRGKKILPASGGFVVLEQKKSFKKRKRKGEFDEQV